MSHCQLFSNHGNVILVLADDPDARLRDVAQKVGITERAVQKIVRDLQNEGLLTVSRHGRRNRYRINTRKALRHPLDSHRTLGNLLSVMRDTPEPSQAPDQAPEASAQEDSPPRPSYRPIDQLVDEAEPGALGRSGTGPVYAEAAGQDDMQEPDDEVDAIGAAREETPTSHRATEAFEPEASAMPGEFEVLEEDTFEADGLSDEPDVEPDAEAEVEATDGPEVEPEVEPDVEAVDEPADEPDVEAVDEPEDGAKKKKSAPDDQQGSLF